jgi:hypothetical protein
LPALLSHRPEASVRRNKIAGVLNLAKISM